jgi:alpha-beta hydrolase superfamily lysophospholipase
MYPLQRKVLLLLICVSPLALLAQINSNFKELPVELKTETGVLKGSLLAPDAKKAVPVILIISGSGPTDRDGNNPAMKNNHLKMLAEELAKRGIASVRYDKRGIAQSQLAVLAEKDLRFDHYIQDAAAWIKQLKNDKSFTKVIVLGHSESSLIGMIAAQETKADAFISLAGAGQKADQLIRQQLQAQPQMVKDYALPLLDSLAAGKTVNNINPAYAALFRPSVQPYLISWFKYDPQQEISKLSIPILIMQGGNDLQVSVSEAKLLAAAKPGSQLVIVEQMNHILKESSSDMQVNMATYSNPQLPLAPQCIETLTQFARTGN